MFQKVAGELDSPVPVPEGMEGKTLLDFPIGEVAIDENLPCIGGFLAEHPAVGGLVQAIVEMVVAHLAQLRMPVGEFQFFQDGFAVTPL